MFRITFSKSNVKHFQQELDKAYKRGDHRGVRRLSVLMMIGCSVALETILSVWNVSQQTVYNWLNDFLVDQFDSLEYRNAPGRPPRLSDRKNGNCRNGLKRAQKHVDIRLVVGQAS